MKLHTSPGSFKAQKVIVAATYGELKLNILTNTSEKDIKKLSAFGKIPVLETSEGVIAESNAIAAYLAAKGSKADQLLGVDAYTKAQITSWLEFCSNEIEIPATVSTYPIIGWMELHPEAFEKAKKDLNIALTTLNTHLKKKTFLVGERLSLADIAVATALLLPFKFLFDEKLRKTFSCATRWFTTCVNQPSFLKVIGSTTLPKVAILPKGYVPAVSSKKALKKGKESKKAVKKTPAPPPPAPKKKEKHYCELLPPSKFNLDSWKRTYSNAKDCYKVMPKFWETFDAEGWSVYRGDYKYNEELEVPFMVSNLAGGFVQRCDGIRKYAFGVVQILKKDKTINITSAWLFRGDSEKLMLDANPDGDTYKWTKLDHKDEASRKIVEEIWCADDALEGMEIFDAKVFK